MDITNTQKAYFNAAQAVASTSTFRKHNIGCIVVWKHKIISSGTNSYKTNPLQKKYNQYRFKEDEGNHYIHAEIDAILPLLDRKDINFSTVSLYIFRSHKNGDNALARPCKSCMRLIKELGVKHLYYTNEKGYSHEQLLY